VSTSSASERTPPETAALITSAAVLHFEANGFPNRIGTIGNAFAVIGFSAEEHVAETAGRIEVPAGRTDSICGDEHSRAGNDAVIDRGSAGRRRRILCCRQNGCRDRARW